MRARVRWIGLLVLLIAAALSVYALRLGWGRRAGGSTAARLADESASADAPLPTHPLFNRDIAPLVYANCAGCHRPGGIGPFSLITFADLRRHGKDAGDLIRRRVMPPWMPDRNCGPFVGERGLSDGQIDLFERWLADGSPEGNQYAPPPPPIYPTGWELGPPDLIVKLPAPFIVSAAGLDVYQNFVLPVGLDTPRSVRAVELRSGNTRVVHHAALLIDSSGGALLRARRRGANSYSGMDPGAGVSGVQGRFLMWQPGSSFCIRTDAEPWALPAGANVVLQMHLRPTGKPESLQPEIGFYFTKRPPAQLLFKLMLRSTSIDIPAGDADYSIDRSYQLPVDAEAVSVSAHAHYLGKDLEGFVTLPDGRFRELLRIPHWNFFWQGSYSLVTPLPLPRGTLIQMHYTYDNSDQNPSNPSSPPRRVRYGLNSVDEMGEFWVVLRVRSTADFRRLTIDYLNRVARPDSVAQIRTQVRLRPGDADLHADLAWALLDAGRKREAVIELQTALGLDSRCARAHRGLANVLLAQGNTADAINHFRLAVAADPADFDSQADLGLALAAAGKIAEGIAQLKVALKLNPRDALTHTNLARVYLVEHQIDDARAELRAALALDPDQPLAIQTMRLIDPGFAPSKQ